MLRAIGLGRREVRAAVASMSVVIVAVGAVGGIVVGSLLGRVIWQAVAGSIGIVDSVSSPVGLLVAIFVTTVGVSSVLALVPANVLLRASPAAALRVE